MSYQLETRQCGAELDLHVDVKYKDELCDDDGSFTMFCMKWKGHKGMHETATILWPEIPEPQP